MSEVETNRNNKTLIYIILLFIFIPVTIILFIISGKSKIEETLYYTETSNLNYSVCLKENNFYEDKCLKKDMAYIASIIDYVNINFDYNFKMNKAIDYNYEYYIDGVITVYEKNNPTNTFFNKTVKLLDTQIKQEDNTDEFNIRTELRINYDEYNDLIRSFKNEYNVFADSSLKLKLYINVNGKYDNFDDDISTDNVMELTIPLSENTININMDYKDINNSDEIVQLSNKNFMNTVYFILGIASAIASLVIIILMIMYEIKKSKSRSDYEKYLDKTLKEYDRLIVTATTKIEEKDYEEIIDVKKFIELIDVADKIDENIVWTEFATKKKKESSRVSWFTVRNGKRLYRKIIKSTDTKFK